MEHTRQNFFEETAPAKSHRRLVEIFKTNVEEPSAATLIVQHLQNRLPRCRINFDLQDCDKILRVEGEERDINLASVIGLVEAHNYRIEYIAE